jgi:hypothetical protein
LNRGGEAATKSARQRAALSISQLTDAGLLSALPEELRMVTITTITGAAVEDDGGEEEIKK